MRKSQATARDGTKGSSASKSQSEAKPSNPTVIKTVRSSKAGEIREELLEVDDEEV